MSEDTRAEDPDVKTLNSLLGDEKFKQIADRASFLSSQFKTRRKGVREKLLQPPTPTKEDLDPEQQHIKDFIEDEFYFISETVKTRISDSEAKIKETFHLAEKGTIQQKVRVCEVTILLLSINKPSKKYIAGTKI